MLWVDEVMPANGSSLSLNHGKLGWSVTLDRGLDFSRSSYLCRTGRVYEAESEIAFEYPCSEDGYDFTYPLVADANRTLLSRRDLAPNGGPRATVSAVDSENCHRVLFSTDGDEVTGGAIDADRKAALLSRVDEATLENRVYYWHDLDSGSRTDIAKPDISQGHHRLRGQYIATFGRDSSTATPDVLTSVWLFNMEDSTSTEIYRPKVNPEIKFECYPEFTKTNGEYVTWTDMCKSTDPRARAYIGLYHIPTGTLTERFHAGSLSRLNQHTLFLLYNPAPEENADGAGLLAIDLETGRQKSLTKNGWPAVAPEVDGKWVAFKIDGWGVFLWDLDRAGITDSEGRLLFPDSR